MCVRVRARVLRPVSRWMSCVCSGDRSKRWLWGRTLARARLGLVIGTGRATTQRPGCILHAGAETRFGVGRGSGAGMRAELSGGTLVGLPQLSRFPIIGPERSRPGLSRLFGTASPEQSQHPGHPPSWAAGACGCVSHTRSAAPYAMPRFLQIAVEGGDPRCLRPLLLGAPPDAEVFFESAGWTLRDQTPS